MPPVRVMIFFPFLFALVAPVLAPLLPVEAPIGIYAGPWLDDCPWLDLPCGEEILDCDILVVEGRVEATMDSRVIHIADKGAFSGKVSIDVAEIHGSFDGELTARSQLIIHATGRVSGKIRYGKLVIEEGGQLSGDIQVGSAGAAAPASNGSASVVRPDVQRVA